MRNSIIFRPCPPACHPDIPFPDIYVPDGFWGLSKSRKLMILQGIYFNRVDLRADLMDSIETLEDGNDLVPAPENILEYQ